jgi:predicted ribosome quality control (RQC) complex YloA/Tae2 family protein
VKVRQSVRNLESRQTAEDAEEEEMVRTRRKKPRMQKKIQATAEGQTRVKWVVTNSRTQGWA